MAEDSKAVKGVPKSDSGKKTAANIVKISDVFSIALRNWYWVMISVVVCIVLAWLYVQRTVPMYTSTSAVMIRDDVQGSMGPSSVDLQDLGIVETNTILEDEMAALKSPDLMQKVVEKLGLQVEYSQPGTFHEKVLYGSNVPVRVSFPDMPADESARLTIHCDAKGKLTVSDFVVNKRNLAINPATPLAFGKAIATPSGEIIVDRTPFYSEGTPFTVIVRRLPMRSAAAKYVGEISLENTVKKSNVVEMTCVDANQTRANDVLAALIEAYNQEWINARAQVVATTCDFINDRLAAVQSELSGVDNSISSFKSANLIPDLSQASSLYMQESNETSNQILQFNNQLQMARYLRNYINTEGKNQVLPVNTGLANTNIEGLIGEYNSMMMQRNQHVGNSSESNPVVIEYDSRLAALRRSIISSIDNQEVSLSTTIRNLERNEQSATARVAANPRQARILLSAERQQKVQESLYLYLLQKREENELTQAFTPINTRIIRRAAGSDAPTSPNSSQIYLIAFVIGLAVPFGVIYGRESVNNKVRGRKDLEALSVPIIGEIPRFKHTGKVSVSYFADHGKHRNKEAILRDVVVHEGNRNLVNEAFRVLRTNVNFVTADSIPSVILLSSFNPGSGKTFVSLNLGISLALKKRKVLIVDCDLRRATLSRFVNNPHKGLAEYLAGTSREVDPLIVHDAFQENLDVLPVGIIPPNPTELLETSRFANLIEYLRTEYEFILLDCPPVEMMADAQIVSRCADRTFFVVRVGLFERPMLQELERYYAEKKYPNMSVILNDSATGSRYGNAYRYGYGYGTKGYKGYHYSEKS